MRIVVNGEPHDLDEGRTVADLIVNLGLGAGPVAVERNGEVVPRAQHADERLAEGDTIEVVHFVGGG